MNPILMLCRNALALTKVAGRSALQQDIPVTLYVVDNDSSDGTDKFLEEAWVPHWRFTPQKGVSASWNFGLDYLFNTAKCDHVLVINNDVQLRPDTYRRLLEEHGGMFATAVSVGDPAQLEWDGQVRIRQHPDFSCFLINRHIWDKVGQFDEAMVLYASDADYHLRLYYAGINAFTIGVPFYHYASGTLKSSEPEERHRIEMQANQDRATFQRKWGCSVGSAEYYKLFGSEAP